MQNFGIFDFDREYLHGTDRHIEYLKKIDQAQTLPHWTKKIWWTLVHK